jgi:hypothetical protein
VILFVDGVIQEVVVDDYIPLNDKGVPIFCQPKILDLTGEFWTLILEKAWAKAKGSYAAIMCTLKLMQKEPLANCFEQ